MKYYIVSDIHGFYTPFIKAIADNGWFSDIEPHRLIICGDLFDRGSEAKELEKFILELIDTNQVILIKGNHEDLFLDYVNSGCKYDESHKHNGTMDTVCQLVGCTEEDLIADPKGISERAKSTELYRTIIPKMNNFFETDHYIFVHGWIPCFQVGYKYFSIPFWRLASNEDWYWSRWVNGMEAWHDVKEEGETIICGHWHASYGHCRYETGGNEFDEKADFTPFYGDGIIAIDACTAHTGSVNCIVIED